MNNNGRQASKPDLVLGRNLANLRRQKALTQMQLGRLINITAQQVDKYENGALIPAPTIEEISEAFGTRVPKKIIRKIINYRKLDREAGLPQDDELIELYNQIFTIEQEDAEDE